MNCEICGIEIYYQPKRIVVDGVKLLACFNCASMGESYWKPVTASAPKAVSSKLNIIKKQRSANRVSELQNVELTDQWWEKIKKARLKRDLTQEELAKLAKEKLSIIQKIETGKMVPNTQLARILEHLLKIKLLVKHEDKEIELKTSSLGELTLGDIIHFKKRNSSKG
ncbi:multiprotein bridging factor aMBF1 [[Eubacterium] cellulosolvens]